MSSPKILCQVGSGLRFLGRRGGRRRPPATRWAAARLHAERLEGRVLLSAGDLDPTFGDTSAAIALPLGFDADEQTSLSVKGEIASLGQRDLYQVDLDAGDVIGVTVQGKTGLDPTVSLLDGNGILLMFNDNQSGIAHNYYAPPESPLPRLNSNSPDSAMNAAPALDNGYYAASVWLAQFEDDNQREKTDSTAPSVALIDLIMAGFE